MMGTLEKEGNNKHKGSQNLGGNERFEVIREDLKDSFYSPKITLNNDIKDNSDFKKFTAEDEQQSSILESKWL